MPICFISTPASAIAPSAASAARSMMSLSGYLPNFVIVIPRIQTSSLIGGVPSLSRSGRLEAVAHGLGASVVVADGVGGELDLHAELHVLGVGLGVDDV